MIVIYKNCDCCSVAVNSWMPCLDLISSDPCDLTVSTLVDCDVYRCLVHSLLVDFKGWYWPDFLRATSVVLDG